MRTDRFNICAETRSKLLFSLVFWLSIKQSLTAAADASLAQFYASDQTFQNQ